MGRPLKDTPLALRRREAKEQKRVAALNVKIAQTRREGEARIAKLNKIRDAALARIAADRAEREAKEAALEDEAQERPTTEMFSVPEQAGVQYHTRAPAGTIWYASVLPNDPLTKRTALGVVSLMVPGQSYEMSVYNYRIDADGKVAITKDYKIDFRGSHNKAESLFTRVSDYFFPAESPDQKHHWLSDDGMANRLLEIDMWQIMTPYPSEALEYVLTPVVPMTPEERKQRGGRLRTREDGEDTCQCVPNLIEAQLIHGQRGSSMTATRSAALKVMRMSALRNNGCSHADYDSFEKSARKVKLIVKDAAGGVLFESHRSAAGCIAIEFVHHNDHAFTTIPAFPRGYSEYALYDRTPLPLPSVGSTAQTEVFRERTSQLWDVIATEKSQRMWLLGDSGCYVTGTGKLTMPRDLFESLSRAAAVSVGIAVADMYKPDLSEELAAKLKAEIAVARNNTTERAYEFKRWIGEMGITPTRGVEHKKIWRACCVEQRVWSCAVTAASQAAAPFLYPLDVRACYPSFVKPSNKAAYPYYMEFGFTARDEGAVFAYNRLVTAADIKRPGATEVVKWTFAAGVHPYVRGLVSDHLAANQWLPNPLLAFLLREKVLVSCFARSTLVSTSKHTGITFPRGDKNLARELLGCLTPKSNDKTSIIVQNADEAKFLEDTYRAAGVFEGIDEHPTHGCSVIRIRQPEGEHRATWIHARASHLAYAHITVLHRLLDLTRKYGSASIHHIRTDSIHLDNGRRTPCTFPAEKPGGWGSWRIKGTSDFKRVTDLEQFGYDTPLSGAVDLPPSEAMPVSNNELQFHKTALCTGQGGNGKTTAALALYPNATVLCDTNELASDYRDNRGVKRCCTYHKFFHLGTDVKVSEWTPSALGHDWVCPTHVIWDEICSVSVAELSVFLPFLESRGCIVVMCGDPGQTTAFAENVPGGVHGWLKSRPGVFHQHLTEDYRAKTPELKAIKLAMHMKPQNTQLSAMRKSFAAETYEVLKRDWSPRDYVIASTREMCGRIIRDLAAVHVKRFGTKQPHRILYSPGLNAKKKGVTLAAPPKGCKFVNIETGETSDAPIKVCNGTMVYVDKRPHESQLGRGFGWRAGSCMTIHGVKGRTVRLGAKLWIVDDSMTFAENMPYTAVSRAESHLQIRLVSMPARPPIVEVGGLDAKKEAIARKIASHMVSDEKTNRVHAHPITVASVIALGNVCYSCDSTVYFTGYPPFDSRQFSVDRIDNTQGHGIGNCRMSCFGCNKTHQGQGLRPAPAYTPLAAVVKAAKAPTARRQQYTVDDLFG